VIARLQQLLTLAAITLGALWFVGCWRAGAPGWAWAGLGTVLFGHAAVLAFEFTLMAHVNRGDGVPAATFGQHFAAWWGETHAAPRVFCWRQPFRSRRWPDHLPEGAGGRRGVVLVHGFVCNRGLWNRWMARLRAAGAPFVAVNLEPAFGSIDEYREIIEEAVRRLERATSMPPLIVAHSMGGLAVRCWMAGLGEAAEGRVHHVVTIGTPHAGTWLARLGVSLNTRQMRRGSRWLDHLREREPASRSARFTCFYSHCDNIVFPASTATLPGADNRHLAAVAHVHMADRPEPFEEALRRLAMP
jgi:triacylglycerol lipase